MSVLALYFPGLSYAGAWPRGHPLPMLIQPPQRVLVHPGKDVHDEVPSRAVGNCDSIVSVKGSIVMSTR